MDKKTVLITGATSGIGLGCACKFARHGYKIILNGRKQDKLHTINKEIGSLENRKKNAEKRAWERLSIRKWVLLILVLGPIIAWLYYIHKSDWENVEKLTYFPPIIYMILVYLYMAIYVLCHTLTNIRWKWPSWNCLYNRATVT